MKVGSLVKLKSGSPVMVVNGKITKDHVKCKWFNGEEICEEDFHVDALTLVDKELGSNDVPFPLDTIVLSQKVVDTKKFTIMKMKEGDLVQFKSGSPTMLISEILDDVHCLCSWFNGSHYHTAEFQINHLKLTEGNAPKPKTQIKAEPSPSLNWIKIDKDNLPPQESLVLCSDGENWQHCYVTNQFEFSINSNITHFAHIELPK